ncbi:MAG: MFS transporter [Patescibacteria group bacterium]
MNNKSLIFVIAFALFSRVAETLTAVVYMNRLITDFGMTNSAAISLVTVLFVASIVLEVPTGYFGDKYGYKNTVMLGAFLSLLAFLFYSFGRQYHYFILAEILGAGGIAFKSGAFESYLNKLFINFEEYKNFSGKMYMGLNIASAIAGLSAGLIAEKSGYTSVYYLSTCLAGIALVSTLGFKKLKRKKVGVKQPSIFVAARDFCNEPKNVSIALVSLFDGFCISAIFNFWSPIATIELNASKTWLGYLTLLVAFGFVFGGFLQLKTQKLLKKRALLSYFVLMLTKAFAIILVGLSVQFGFWAFVASFFLFEVLQALQTQHTLYFMQESFQNNINEATLNSLLSLAFRLGGAGGCFLLRCVADDLGRVSSVTVSGCLLAFAVVSVGLIYPNYQRWKLN